MNIRKFATITVLVLSSFAATNVAPTKAELESMYDKAFREFNANNYPQALKELDAIDARQPDLAESQNLRGVILMRQAEYDQAEAALQRALATDPRFWNARFNLAEIPFLRKDWTEARKRFDALLQGNAAELQGEAAQLIQYKILLTYLLQGNENMVDSILAKFELSPDTPAANYSHAAIALQHKNEKEAKDLLATAEKNFSPQLNKLFAESLYEVGWLQKPVGQTRAALELTSAADRAAKAKSLATEKYEQAEQAFQQRDLTAARRLVDEADAADPNQAATANLRGEILLAQKDFDAAEAAFKQALKIDPKLSEAHYNLAQIPFKKKEYAKARDRFAQTRELLTDKDHAGRGADPADLLDDDAVGDDVHAGAAILLGDGHAGQPQLARLVEERAGELARLVDLLGPGLRDLLGEPPDGLVAAASAALPFSSILMVFLCRVGLRTGSPGGPSPPGSQTGARGVKEAIGPLLPFPREPLHEKRKKFLERADSKRITSRIGSWIRLIAASR